MTAPKNQGADWRGFAKLGFSVFPLKPRSKMPLSSWKRFQTGHATADELTKWSTDPTLNAAIATGANSGIIVLDTDSDDAEAEVMRRGVPNTPTVKTSKGRHRYFKHPGGIVPNFAGLLPGCDIRGDGGYVVAAGSTHPDGSTYEWEKSPSEVPFADMSEWLRDMIAAKQAPAPALDIKAPTSRARNPRANVQATIDRAVKKLREAPVGTRNTAFNAVAFAIGQLIGAGHIAETDARILLTAEARQRGLGEGEIRGTIESGLTKGKANPRDPSNHADGKRGPKQADILIELAQSAELFHTPDDKAFADVVVNGHRETWPVRSKSFNNWLLRLFFEKTGGSPSSEALQSALNMIGANAQFSKLVREVHIRVGGVDDRLYIDLGDKTWRAIEIDAHGWRVINSPPVRFRRATGMQPLPVPVGGGSINSLRPLLNVKSDADFVLTVAWALAVLRNRGPYPVLVLAGEQGSAKSTFAKVLRKLLDPNKPLLRSLPREERDLFITASNSHMLAFDNVSVLQPWISDTLCTLSTGGGFAARQLYSDQEEVLIDVTRPVILNGIEDYVTRPDLADRALLLTLKPIPDEFRLPEAKLWAEFDAEHARILGVLLDALAEGIKRLPTTNLSKPPRMADFAVWVTACEPALWPPGTFGLAYGGNRDEAMEGVIDGDPIAASVRVLMAEQTVWTGTATDLLASLSFIAGERVEKSKNWPDSPRALSGRLRRAATFLRQIGIEFDFTKKGRARTRTIHITTSANSPVPENAGDLSSASSTDAQAPVGDPETVFGPAAPVAGSNDRAPPATLETDLATSRFDDMDALDDRTPAAASRTIVVEHHDDDLGSYTETDEPERWRKLFE